MEKDNLNENPWGRKLTDEQMMQEDELRNCKIIV